MSRPTKSRKQTLWKPSLPFEADYNDHFETPRLAYEHVAPLLDLVQSDRSRHRLYDPYYCNGRAQVLLKELGFLNVVHECRDFYQDLRRDSVPDFDTLITNPPYSDQHKDRCLQFAVRQLRLYQRPFFLLMPNYVAAKRYYRRLLLDDVGAGGEDDVLYLVPSTRYEYNHPEGTGHEVAPFDSIWYCGIGKASRGEALRRWRETDGKDANSRLVTIQQLREMGAVPTQKRPNPRQRRKKQHRAAELKETFQTPGAIGSNADTVDRHHAAGGSGVGADRTDAKRKKTSRYRDQHGTRTKRRF